MEEESAEIIRILVIGGPEVGKTALIDRYINETFDPDEEYFATIATDFNVVTRSYDNSKSYKFQIFDIPGADRFQSQVESFSNDVDILIAVFSFDIKESLEFLGKRLDKFDFFDGQPIVYLVGAKNDFENGKRSITDKEINDFKSKRNIAHYYVTSAKTGENVKELFENIMYVIQQQSLVLFDFDIEEDNIVEDVDLLNSEEEMFYKRSKCCWCCKVW